MNEVILRNQGGEDTQLLTVRETYERLRISKWKLYDLIHTHKVEAIKIGRRTLIPLRSVETYIRGLWQESLA